MVSPRYFCNGSTGTWELFFFFGPREDEGRGHVLWRYEGITINDRFKLLKSLSNVLDTFLMITKLHSY